MSEQFRTLAIIYMKQTFSAEDSNLNKKVMRGLPKSGVFFGNDPPPTPPPGWALSKKHPIFNLFPLASSTFYAAAVPVNNWLKPLWLADDDFCRISKVGLRHGFLSKLKAKTKTKTDFDGSAKYVCELDSSQTFSKTGLGQAIVGLLQQWEWQIAKPCDSRNKRHSPPALASDMITFWLHCRYILVILRCILVKMHCGAVM